MIMKAANKYNPTMRGTSLLATFAILWIPPKITTETKPATKTPVIKLPILGLV